MTLTGPEVTMKPPGLFKVGVVSLNSRVAAFDMHFSALTLGFSSSLSPGMWLG